ncbi:MAG: MFS transporter [Acidobacteriota bacterium]|nr:MFS transporter [Acidobacteriota bacterium]
MGDSRSTVLAATSTCHGWIHVCELSVPAVLLAIQADFGVGDLEMGRVVALYTMLFGVGSLPAGLLVDRFGSRFMLLACMFGAGLSLAAMALSHDLITFTASAAVMGAALSIYHPAGTTWISHALPQSGRIFAWHGMAGNTGVALASLIVGGLGWKFGWRTAFGVLAIVSILIGFWLTTIGTTGRTHSRIGSLRAPRYAAIIALLVGIGFTGMVYRGMTTFLPKLFAQRMTDVADRGVLVGGIWTTVALCVGLLGMYVAGRLSDHGIHPAMVFLIGALMQIPFLIMIPHVHGMTTVPLVMAVSFFHFFTQPVGNQLVARLTPPELRGVGFGLYFMLSFGLGASGAYVGGWVSDRYGLAATFTALAILAVPAVLSMLLIRRWAPGSKVSASV